MGVNHEFFASCLGGLEKLLAAEIEALGVRRVRPLSGGVAFFGDAIDGERVCLWSRLASRVTVVIGRIAAADAESLYNDALGLPWASAIAPGATVAVRAHGANDELRNTQFTALKVKDALCDALRLTRGERPAIDAKRPDASVEVRVRGDRATVSLDLSGASLHARANARGRDATLECSYTAGLLAFAGWADLAAKGWTFSDPVHGDGVLAEEAQGIADGAAPGLARHRWGFLGWGEHDDAAWREALAEARARSRGGREGSARGAAAGSGARRGGFGSAQGGFLHSASENDAKGASSAARHDGEGSDDAAFRQLSDGFGSAGAGAPAVLVASVFLPEEQLDARYAAAAEAFFSACASAPDGSRFAVAGAPEAADRFGEGARVSRMGTDRIALPLAVADRLAFAGSEIAVPDAHGGAEHRVRVFEQGSDQFAARLRKVAKERRKWARREGVSCYRVYDADLPEYAVAVDVYEGAREAKGETFLHIAEYQPPSSVDADRARRRFADVLAVAPVALGVPSDHVFAKTRLRAKGGSQYRSADRRAFVTHVSEGGLVFEVDLSGYLDTGLFLDHRPTRMEIGRIARDARFLNLFAYTGTATVHAAAGGAASTTTVDLSNTYLEWAKRNMELNGFTGSEHAFVRADAQAWVTEARRRGERFDLVFVDPPTFSNSKSKGARTWDVQRDHAELLIGVSRLLADGGEAVFSCNLRSFKPDVETLARYGVDIEDVTPITIPHDFERNPKIHRCYVVRRA